MDLKSMNYWNQKVEYIPPRSAQAILHPDTKTENKATGPCDEGCDGSH